MKVNKKFILLILAVILIIIIVLPNIKVFPDKNEVSFRSITGVNSNDQEKYCPPLSLDTKDYKRFVSDSGYSLQYHPYLKSAKIMDPKSYDYRSTGELVLKASSSSLSDIEVGVLKMSEKTIDNIYYKSSPPENILCALNNDSKIIHYYDSPLGTRFYHVIAYIKSPKFSQDDLIIGIVCIETKGERCKKLVPQIVSTLKFY